MTRIHLVDDEEAIRKSLRLMLRMAGFEVNVFESGIAFLDSVAELEPGCLLLDVRMPEMSGLEVQEELARRGVAMPTIVMTGHGDLAVAVAALRAGAADFVEKPFERARILAAIERACTRGRDAAGHDAVADAAAQALAALSASEREVLEAFSHGLSNQAAAAALGLGLAEVEMARAAIMGKLGATSLAEAIRTLFLARPRGRGRVARLSDST